MANAISANRAELLAIANSVASEKLIDKAIVIEAIEEAIQRAARARFGQENDIRAKLDPQTGDLRLWRVVEVVELVDDYFKQVSLKDGQKLQPGAAGADRKTRRQDHHQFDRCRISSQRIEAGQPLGQHPVRVDGAARYGDADDVAGQGHRARGT